MILETDNFVRVQWASFQNRLNAYWNQRLRSAFQVSGLEPVKVNFVPYLSILHEKGAVSMSELAQALGTAQANATAAIRVLEKAGLVRRGQSRSDGRIIIARLTDQGVRAAEIVLEVWFKGRRDMYQGIDPQDLQCAMRVIDQIYANISR